MRRRHAPATSLTAISLVALALVAASAVPAVAVAPLPRAVATFPTPVGTAFGIALSPAGSTAYVANTSDRITLIDTATNQVAGSSDSLLGLGPQRDVAVSADGSRVYAAQSTGLRELSATGGILDSISSAPGTLIAVAPAGSPDVVMATGDEGGSPRLYRFDFASSPASVSTLSFGAVPVPLGLYDIAVAPDGRVFASGLTSAGEGALYVFDDVFGANPHVVPLPGSNSAAGLALRPDGAQLAVTAPVTSEAFIVDTASETVTTVSTPRQELAAAYSPDGSTVYLSGDGGLDVLDAATASFAGTVAVPGSTLASLAVSPSGNRIWAPDAGAPGAAGIMFAASAVSAPAGTATAGSAFSLAFSASGFDLPVTYVVSPALPAGLTLDPATGAVSGTPATAQPSTGYTVTASAGDGDQATTAWTLEIAAPSSPDPSASSAPTAAEPAGRQLAASGTEAPTWALGFAAALIAVGVAALTVSAARTARRQDRRVT